MRFVRGESKISHPCHCPEILLLWLALQCSVLMTVGIRLEKEKVVVPKVGYVGGFVTLQCHFKLDDDNLYSLKWYKDGKEFYRYLPKGRPSVVTFQYPGVHVDTGKLHNVNQVTLLKLDLNSTGIYRCEISSESPYFQTLAEERKLTVIIPPTPTYPTLSNFPPSVYMGDYLSGNCTSSRSSPPSNLTILINDRKWAGVNVTSYEPVKEVWDNGTVVWTSTVSLRARVHHNFFSRGVIPLRCVADILGQKWEATKNITHLNKSYQPPMYSNQYSSASSRIRWPKPRNGHWTFPTLLVCGIPSLMNSFKMSLFFSSGI